MDRDTELDYETALKNAGSEVAQLIQEQNANSTKLADAFKVLGYKL